MPDHPFTEALQAATARHPQAKVTLTAALNTNQASHAYLFHGPHGVGKSEAATAFAASLLTEGANDKQSAFDRATRHAHPDLTWVKPSGAHAMLIDDIAEPVLRGASRTPMEGNKRVFVIERTETMSSDVANRMLKTLEEPAESVHFILLTAEPESVLPTIASRCQSVRFDAIPTQEVAQTLQQEGVEQLRAESCAALAGGDLPLARELATEEGDAMRSEAGKIVGCALRGVSGRDRPWEAVLARATTAGEQAEAQELELLEARIEAFPKGRERTAAQKEGEQSAHRTARRVRSDQLDLSLRVAALLLRDLATAASGNTDLLLAKDRAETIAKTAAARPLAPLLDAATEVDDTRGMLNRNVAEELTLQALSFRLDRLLAGV